MNSTSSSAAEADVLPIGELTPEFFQPLINETFFLHWGGEKPEFVELLSVTPSSRPAPEGFRMAFSLIFRASSRAFYLPQAIYSLEHAEAGRLEIFLVPIGPDDTGMLFQSIFN